MSSEKQREANRKNALKSTGPRSVRGKANSRANAYKHGLTAEKIITFHEKAADFEALRDRLICELGPGSQLEHELSERIASITWRLRRIPIIEAGLLVGSEAKNLNTAPENVWILGAKPIKRDFFPTTKSPEEVRVKDEDRKPGHMGELVAKAYDLTQVRLADAFSRDIAAGDNLNKLSRYETLLMGQLEKNLQLFHKLKATRIEQENIIEETAVLNGHANGKAVEATLVDDLEDPGF